MLFRSPTPTRETGRFVTPCGSWGSSAARAGHHRAPADPNRGCPSPLTNPVTSFPSTPQLVRTSSAPTPRPAPPPAPSRNPDSCPSSHRRPRPLSKGPSFLPRGPQVPPQTLRTSTPQPPAPEPLLPFPQDPLFTSLPSGQLPPPLFHSSLRPGRPGSLPALFRPTPFPRPRTPPPHLVSFLQQQPLGVHPYPPQAPAPATGAVSRDQRAGLLHSPLCPGSRSAQSETPARVPAASQLRRRRHT